MTPPFEQVLDTLLSTCKNKVIHTLNPSLTQQTAGQTKSTAKTSEYNGYNQLILEGLNFNDSDEDMLEND